MGKLKSGRLGRYKNRQEARKNVLNSWDRDLSIDEVKWSIKDENQNGVKTKNGNESGRLGRYTNRNWAGKNFLNSWDRGKIIDELKSSFGDTKFLKKDTIILDFEIVLTSYFQLQNFDDLVL